MCDIQDAVYDQLAYALRAALPGYRLRCSKLTKMHMGTPFSTAFFTYNLNSDYVFEVHVSKRHTKIWVAPDACCIYVDLGPGLLNCLDSYSTRPECVYPGADKFSFYRWFEFADPNSLDHIVEEVVWIIAFQQHLYNVLRYSESRRRLSGRATRRLRKLWEWAKQNNRSYDWPA